MLLINMALLTLCWMVIMMIITNFYTALV